MKKITITDTDKTRAMVLLTALKKGTWTLEGEEILAFAQVFHWVAELKARLENAEIIQEEKSDVKETTRTIAASEITQIAKKEIKKINKKIAKKATKSCT